MGLDIANIKNFTKYANKMPTRQPVGNELRKFYSGDKAKIDSFVKSFTKPKVQIPSDTIISATKTFKDTFVKVAESSPRPVFSKINLNELYTQAMKFMELTKK